MTNTDTSPTYEELLQRVSELEAAEKNRQKRYKAVQEKAHLTLEQMSQSSGELISDLQIYQVELEIQNEELRNAQHDLEQSRDRFADLFHQAPVGYVVLNQVGMIIDANHTFSSMLSLEQNSIKQKPFSMFLIEEDRHLFISRYSALFKKPEKKILEMQMETAGSKKLHVRLEARLLKENRGPQDLYAGQLLMAVTDINDSKAAQEREEHIKKILKIGRDVNQVIATAPDLPVLLKEICRVLTHRKGYFNAWIALLNKEQSQAEIVEAEGFGPYFKPLETRLRKGQFPEMFKKSLQTPNTVMVKNPVCMCTDCPLSGTYQERGGLVQRLEFNGTVYGVLAVSVDQTYVENQEELALFEQISKDVSLGVNKIKAEEVVHWLTQVVNHVSFPMSFIDTSYRYQAVNEVYIDFFQVPREEILGKTTADFIGQTLFEKEVKPNLDRCLSGELVHYDTIVEFPGKGKRYMTMSYFPYRDPSGAITGVISHGVDMTELHHSERRLQKILDNTPLGVCITDENGYFELVNPSYCKLYQYQKEELLGKHFTMVVPEEHRAVLSRLHDDFIAGQKELRGEWEVMDKKGNRISIMADAALINGIDGRPRKVTFVMDITERKELDRLKEDIDRIMRHDLKQPLNAIIGYPGIIEMKGGLTDAQREMLNSITESGQKMLTMIDASLDMFKMETGHYEYLPFTVDLLDVLRQVLEQFQSRLKVKKLTCQILWNGSACPDGLSVIILSDENLLYTLLSNLLANALEASQTGQSIRLLLREKSHDPALYELVIENNGVVPKAVRDDFFGKYKTAGKTNGTGLGTYSAKLLANTMNYGIAMQTSEEENLTRLILTLTAAEQFM